VLECSSVGVFECSHIAAKGNLADSRIPVLWRNRLAIPVLFDGCDDYFEHVPNEKPEFHLAANGLTAVYLNPKLTEVALLPSVRFLGIGT